MEGAATRESLARVGDRFEEIVAGCDQPTLDLLGSELSAVAGLLDNEAMLRKHLSEASSTDEAKQGLVDQLFSSKVSEPTLELLRAAVGERWSRVRDLVDAIERFARLAVLHSAERAGVAAEVEDELFRFGRVLAGEGRLTTLLSDEQADTDARVRLLDGLIGQKVRPQTEALLAQAVRVPRGRMLDLTVEGLAELAAARRQEIVAHVITAAPLTEAQRGRLSQVLASIYGRAVSLQVEVDEHVLGGLVVRVGDEVIDGSIASKLARAKQDLPH
ncbi:F0F1 ATP synthase subunit delta [Sciscionella sediminilitoris]|uniref:F0F1 ATP synthase subunit delta n=1 Tax=Sciscionella sediminilitoris TaxID=1445613 RepID=UPI0004DFA7F7|nr:F0F1 ATP synthase subunit delta [Sciscionella sp. SE31]